MEPVISGKNILERADRIRLTRRELARRSGLHQNTLTSLASTDTKRSTLRLARFALVEAELELRDYLIELHGTAPRMIALRRVRVSPFAGAHRHSRGHAPGRPPSPPSRSETAGAISDR